MKNILEILGISLVILLSSCTKNTDPLSDLDFGRTIYKDPFVGLLKNKSNLLLKTCHYPPISYFYKDSIYLDLTLEIEFNEESIRNKSNANILFRDSLSNTIDDLNIYHNGTLLNNNNLHIIADSLIKTVHLRLSMLPREKNEVFKGVLLIITDEIDIINSDYVQYDSTHELSWSFKQKNKVALVIWIIWIIYIVILIYISYKLVLFFIRSISNIKSKKENALNEEITNKNDLISLLKHHERLIKKIFSLKKQSPKKKLKLINKYGLNEWYRTIEKEIIYNEMGDKALFYEMTLRELIDEGNNKYLEISNNIYPNSQINLYKNNVIYAKGGNIKCNSNLNANEYLQYPIKNAQYNIDKVFKYTTNKKHLVKMFEADLSKAYSNTSLIRGGRPDSQTKSVTRLGGTKGKDQGGHLIANRFNGISENINYIPLRKELNENGGKWYKMEEYLANEIKKGKNVKIKGKLRYPRHSSRPKLITVIAYINGRRKRFAFKNTIK